MTPRQHAIELVRFWAIFFAALLIFYAAAQAWIDHEMRRRRGRRR